MFIGYIPSASKSQPHNIQNRQKISETETQTSAVDFLFCT